MGMLPAQSFALEDEIEIKVEIKDGITEIEIETQELEAEFELDTTNEDEIIAAIMEFVDLSADEIRDVWKFEVKDDEHDEFEDEIEIKVEIKDGITEIKIETQELEAEFELDTTNEDEIIAAIMEFVDLSADQIRDVWKFEFEHDDEFEREDRFEDEGEFDFEEHDKEFDGLYYDDVDREYDYEFDRERDMRGEECIVDEDREVIIGDEACILEVFDEIPKQNCIISTADGLIWYEKECVFEHDEPKRDHARECIVEKDDSVVVADEECLLQKYDEIPHLDCATFEDGLVFYEKECTYKK